MKKKYERVLAVLLVAVFVLGLCSNVRVRAEEKDNQRTQMDLIKAEEISEGEKNNVKWLMKLYMNIL